MWPESRELDGRNGKYLSVHSFFIYYNNIEYYSENVIAQVIYFLFTIHSLMTCLGRIITYKLLKL